MKKLMLVAILALVLAALGCAAETTEQTETTTEAAPVNIFEVHTKWVADFAIGSDVAPNGTVNAPKTSFAPGEAIFFSAAVKDAPPASAVQLVWMGPNATKLGQEMKGIAEGQAVVYFQSPDTSAWAPGQYEAQLWVVDEKVNAQRFEIAGPDAATDTTATQTKAPTKK